MQSRCTDTLKHDVSVASPSLEIGKNVTFQYEPITVALCDTCVSCHYIVFVKVGVNAPLEALPSTWE